MEEEKYAGITIRSRLGDKDSALEDAQELAWNHAQDFSGEMGYKLGSDDFVEVYNELNSRYKHQIDHLKFFMMSALVTVRELLESGTVELPFNGEDALSEKNAAAAITKAAHTLLSSYMWLAAGYEFTWPHNDELPDTTQLTFMFPADTIWFEEESE